MSDRFSTTFTARAHDIDVMGHVNNAVWVQWMEAIAVAHWEADATPEQVERYVWVVTRHEIDYRGNIAEGETVTAETFIPEGPTGARFDRRVEFRNGAGKVIVAAKTTWAMIDRQTGRIMRVPPEVAVRFSAG
ncbi:acyl-CoA thioester hydrolase [Novosphingobium sp. PhB165]|uniref:acyl-CoA thioesterase n=1 Tax=Novosphingobium sp. PhB165 TaxID=2485105 RepID=UPI0010472489|nr:thioesterase family protein [Novosphingobium sp. PhB165]TCM16997.1 acyl-CoA thioester hydrolase [Novosphingobium sp. PhB165]